MDIQRWLDETVLPQQPPSPSAQPPSAFISKAKQPERNRRRKLSIVDSSIIHVRPARKRLPQVEHEDSGDDGACSDASHSAGESKGGSTSSHPYARRPRRKTRLECYEPAAKAVKDRGAHVQRARKGESNKTERKSGRKKTAKPGSGIVQSFHAKNVPGERLTLRPQEKLGIFNKGRASSPVKGRGLPDLVFSEMKFLQRDKDQPGAVSQPGIYKSRRKQDQTHAREDDISAYFTSVRPALAEKEVNIQAKEGTGSKRAQPVDHEKRKLTAVIGNAVSTIELPVKAAYLGFGSRGPRHESRSHISWSESIRASSASPVPARSGPAIHTGQLNSIHGRHDNGSADGVDALHSQRTPPSANRHMTDGSGGRFQLSSLAPPDHRLSRSHPLPHCTSPRPTNLVNRALKTAASPSSMLPLTALLDDSNTEQRQRPYVEVSSASKSISLSNRKCATKQLQEGDVKNDDESDVNDGTDLYTSSHFGRVLQECTAVFNESRQTDITQSNQISDELAGAPAITGPGAYHQSYIAVRRLPTVRFVGVDTYRPNIPNFAGRSIYEEQAQRREVARQHRSKLDGALQDPLFANADVEPDYDGGDGGDGGDWDGHAEETPWGMEAGLAEANPAEHHRADHGEENVEQTASVVASGFWRPHRLY